MYEQTLEKINANALAKARLLESKGKYFVASLLAGMYVGFGILLIFSISGQLGDNPATKLAMGASFGVALSLVIIAGSELFTGNNLVLTVGNLSGKVKSKQVLSAWLICYIGNLCGALLISLCFVFANLGGESAAGLALSGAAVAKASASPIALIFRGFLCNVLVCLAVLCAIKLENEVAKLIMIWWCLFVFITAGFEHSIANMTIYLTSIIANTGVSIMQMAYNLLFVTIGNMIGGIALACAYYYLGATSK